MLLRDSSPVMEKLAERFPHLLELILSRLDDPTLENSRLVSKSWRNFVDWFWLVKQLRIYKTKTLGNKSLILLHEDWRKFFLHLESDLEALRLTVPLMKQYYQCNKSSTKEYTPLHYAVKKGHLAIVSYFLETINLQTTDKHGRTLLHIACLSERNQQEIMKLLSQCLKITKNVALEFWHFPPIFVLLKLTCLVTLFDRKLQVFKNSPKLAILGIFN